MTIDTIVRKSLIAALAALVSGASFAATRTWTGGGDGITWSQPANWEDGNVPETSSDSVVIVSGASELVISNDVARNISGISISGSSPVRIVGEQLTLSVRAYPINSSVPITVDAPIAFNNNDSTYSTIILQLANSVFNGKLSVLTEGRDLRFYGTGKASFYGPVDGESTTIQMRMSGGMYFYAPLNVKALNTDNDIHRAFYLASSGNKIADGIQLHYCKAYFTAENALDESVSIGFMQNVNKDNSENTCYYFDNGCVQVAKCISSDAPYYNGWKDTDFIKATSAMTLTLKAAEDASTYACLRGPLSLVFDPKTPCTQTFLDRKHETTGSIMVKGGTLRMDGTNTFASVPSVTVGAGATFDVATTNTAALASVTALTLGDGARFAVAPTAASLFGSSATLVRARSSSRLVIPSGTALRVGSLVVDGVPVAPGDYSQTGDGSSILPLAQVEGSGTLTVDSLPSGNWWTGAENSSWNDADNWSLGEVPASATFIRTPATGPVIVGGDDITFNMSGLAADDTTPTLTIDGGASLSVTGGSLSITNICGAARIGDGDASVTSRVEVSGGVLNLHYSRNTSFAIDKGGLLRLTGGETRIHHKYYINGNPKWIFRMRGGAFVAESGAYASIKVSYANGDDPKLFLGSGDVCIRGNSRLDLTGTSAAIAYWTPEAAGESLVVDIAGNAAVTNTYQYAYIGGYYDDARTVVSVRENASVKMPTQVIVGYGDPAGLNTYGELSVSDNAKLVGGGSLFVANNGTSANTSSGKVSVSGGVLNIAEANPSAATSPKVRGLVVGYNPYTGGGTNIDNAGVFELSGGAVTNNQNNCVFAVGYGNARGDFMHTGGTFAQGNAASYIGWYGGIGRYAFSGDGSANFGSSAVKVGANGGKGTLEIGTGTGTFTAKSLTVEGSESAIKFVLGADGTVAGLAVNNAFTVDSNAKLVIDAMNSANAKSITLMTYGSRSGEFAAENIEILAAKPEYYHIEQTATSIRLMYQRPGLMMIVK